MRVVADMGCVEQGDGCVVSQTSGIGTNLEFIRSMKVGSSQIGQICHLLWVTRALAPGVSGVWLDRHRWSHLFAVVGGSYFHIDLALEFETKEFSLIRILPNRFRTLGAAKAKGDLLTLCDRDIEELWFLWDDYCAILQALARLS